MNMLDKIKKYIEYRKSRREWKRLAKLYKRK